MKNPTTQTNRSVSSQPEFSTPEDEISILDLYLKIAKGKWVFLGIFFGCIGAGALYAALAPADYEYTSIIRIESPPTELNGSTQLDAPDARERIMRAAEAKLRVVLIPQVARELVMTSNKNLTFEDLSNAVSVENPKGSDLITLSATASREDSGIYIAIMQGAADLLVVEHREAFAQLLRPRLTDIENAVARLANTAGRLEEKIENLEAKLQLAESDFKDLRAHLEAMESVDTTPQASGSRDDRLSVMLVKNTIFVLKNRITYLEQELKAALTGLTIELDTEFRGGSRSQRIEQQLLTNFELTLPVDSERTETFTVQGTLLGGEGFMGYRPTQVIQAPIESSKPVAPKTTLVLVGSGFLGLVLGVIVVLLADFFRNAHGEFHQRRSLETM